MDIKNRRIEIRKSKTDHATEYQGRTIVMNVIARALLTVLQVRLIGSFRYSDNDRIFPMTREAFKQSWADVVKRAGIDDLHFHDLRREAGSRFDEAGLTRGEHDLMMGHANKDMASLYISADLKSIQDRLDRFRFGGKTWDEREAELTGNPYRPSVSTRIERAIEIWTKRLEDGKPVLLADAMNQALMETKAGV